MNKLTKMKFIFLMLIAGLVLVPQAFAATTGVNIEMTSASASLCPSNTEYIMGHITNNGDILETYTLSSDNSWATIAPDKITLNSGETKEFHVYITPFNLDAQPTTYPISIKATGSTSSDFEIITLTLLKCHGVKIAPEKSADTLCIGDRKTYDVTITNYGGVTEIYDITSTTGTLLDKQVTLDADESKTITIAIDATKEKQIVEITAQSRTSYATAKETMDISGINCYNSKIQTTPETKTMCVEESSTYTVKIENLGTKDDTYTLSTDFGELDTETINIGAGETKTATLTVQPKDMGVYDINVNAKSLHSDMNSKVRLSAINCKGIAVLTIPPEMTVCKGTTARYMITMKNTGSKEDTFNITSTKGIVSENIISIGSGEIKNTYIEIDTNNLDFTTYDFEVTAKSTIEDSAKGSFTVENCYGEDLIIEDAMKSTCAGNDAVYAVTVKNTGKNDDSYALSVKGAIGIFETENLTINAFEEKTVMLTIKSDKDSVGDKTIEITSQSSHVSETITVNLEFMDKNTCYGYSTTTNPKNIEATESKGYLYTVSVQNTGLYDSNYVFSVEGPNWVSVAPETIAIKAGDTDKTYVYAAPPYGTESGVYEITFTIKNDEGIIKQSTLQFAFNEELGDIIDDTTDTPVVDEQTQYIADVNDTTIYTIDSENIEIITATYTTSDGVKKSFDIGFETGSFIVTIGDARVEDENPSIGEKTYSLLVDDTQYEITLDFEYVNTTSKVYEFSIINVDVTENANVAIVDDTKEVPSDDETKKDSSKIIYAIVIGIILILLILFGPELAEMITKTKEDEDEEPSFGISGIGPKREATLKKEGIKTVEELAESDASNIASILGVSEAQAKKFINTAAKKVRATKKEEPKVAEKKAEEPKKEKETKKPAKKKQEKDVKDEIKDILDNI
ncbi:hypothetical protein GQ473_07525 [archaeon]|nr:hypothetical protein [archaeon]